MTPDIQPSRPRYGEGFRCIGAACEDTCCHGWGIPVDRTTYEKYQAFPEGDLRSLVTQHVALNTVDASDTLYARINLTPSRDCPFLATNRLCKVQKEYGSGFLSATCSIYPRVLNRVDGELEVSLPTHSMTARELQLWT
jgi:lysine-N-methylase